jgi:hypothetical protein
MNLTKKQFKSNDGKLFEVREVLTDAGKLWVYYNEVGQDREYSCLLEAFVDRFTTVENQE